MAAMVLKALEDKTYRGAIIASPATPWGGGPNANEATISGYHAVGRATFIKLRPRLRLPAIGPRRTVRSTIFSISAAQRWKFSAEFLGRWPGYWWRIAAR